MLLSDRHTLGEDRDWFDVSCFVFFIGKCAVSSTIGLVMYMFDIYANRALHREVLIESAWLDNVRFCNTHVLLFFMTFMPMMSFIGRCFSLQHGITSSTTVLVMCMSCSCSRNVCQSSAYQLLSKTESVSAIQYLFQDENKLDGVARFSGADDHDKHAANVPDDDI